jgi:hypothetical protein
MKRIAVMQPYFMPYIGYFQMVKAVDQFVIYDDIQYTKQSWFNRNRFLLNGKPHYFTIPVKKDSDYLNVDEREVSPDYQVIKKEMLTRFKIAYQKAPYFDQVYPLLQNILNCDERNLYHFIRYSFDSVCDYLKIDTEVIPSSHVNGEEKLSGKERLIDICKKLGAEHYINLPGGRALYDKKDFEEEGIRLSFIDPVFTEYDQFGEKFIPCLSILDVMMFNPVEEIREMLFRFELK